MPMIDQGSGPALVLIPGIQGRWEYLRPAVESLSTSFRVITFPLCDEPSSPLEFDSAHGFDSYVAQVRRLSPMAESCGTILPQPAWLLLGAPTP